MTAITTTIEATSPRYRVTSTNGERSVTRNWHRNFPYIRACDIPRMNETCLEQRLKYAADRPDGTTALLINGALAAEDSFSLEMHRTPVRYLNDAAAEIRAQRPLDTVEVRHITIAELWDLWEQSDRADD